VTSDLRKRLLRRGAVAARLGYKSTASVEWLRLTGRLTPAVETGGERLYDEDDVERLVQERLAQARSKASRSR